MYQSEQKDSESGLIYLRARYYDPSIGRFTSQDPLSGSLSSPASQNGYNYANNDPINLNDPSGLAAACNTAKTASYTKPNAFLGYVHWLAAGGTAQTVKTNTVNWKLNTTDLQGLGLGNVSGKVGASALGFNAFEQIGRVGGVFTGVITNSATGYNAVGTFTPYTDTYDFNNDPNRGRAANGAAAIGRIGGNLVNKYTLGIIKPTDYSIQFDGSVNVKQSW
jgi:RHS repeat-associated protein